MRLWNIVFSLHKQPQNWMGFVYKLPRALGLTRGRNISLTKQLINTEAIKRQQNGWRRLRYHITQWVLQSMLITQAIQTLQNG